MDQTLLRLVDDGLLMAAQVADTLGIDRAVVLGASRDHEVGAAYVGRRRIPLFDVDSALALRNSLLIVGAA